MTKSISLVDALTGKIPAVKQLRYQFTCPSCGRDNGMDNMPFSIKCIGFNCFAEIEATDNPLYPSRMTFQVPERV